MTEADLEEPIITPLVRALTRPPTKLGVPYMAFMVNGVVTSVCFIVSHNLLMLFVFIPLHVIAYLLTIRDDRIFSIINVRLTKTPPRSRQFWNADSYKA